MIAMRATNNTSHVIVDVSRADVERFRSRWPGSGMPIAPVTFVFEASGDLVDITSSNRKMMEYDGSDMVALSQDAQEYAASKGYLRHRNPRGSGMTQKEMERQIRALGLTVRVADGEIRVQRLHDPGSAYFTTDREDAVATARLMAKRYASNPGNKKLPKIRPGYAPYGWIIDRDDYYYSEDAYHLDGEKPEDGTAGPRNIDPQLLAKLKADKSVGYQFKMYDDDRNLIYTGRCVVDEDHPNIEGEEPCAPLFDFGSPNFGCTYIKYPGKPEWDCG